MTLLQKLSSTALLIVFQLGFQSEVSAAPPGSPKESCTTTKEFITTLEFLRAKKDVEIPDKDAFQVAREVSEGCTGAAQRFVRSLSVLRTAEVSGRDAVRTAISLAQRNDVETESFITVFQKAYAREFLDLDVTSALKLARALSVEFQGDILGVKNDFEKLVEFCTTTKSLDLPKPRCAEFAVNLARQGENHSGGIAQPFITLFRFMQSSDGPELGVAQALKLSEELVASGPSVADNFIQAFKYATSKKGLAMPSRDAFAFAKKMATGS